MNEVFGIIEGFFSFFHHDFELGHSDARIVGNFTVTWKHVESEWGKLKLFFIIFENSDLLFFKSNRQFSVGIFTDNFFPPTCSLILAKLNYSQWPNIIKLIKMLYGLLTMKMVKRKGHWLWCDIHTCIYKNTTSMPLIYGSYHGNRLFINVLNQNWSIPPIPNHTNTDPNNSWSIMKLSTYNEIFILSTSM